MEPLPVLEQKYTIGISDVDFLQTLKISSLFGYFQEIASFHANNLGIGLDAISSKHNVTWVLVKIKVEIDQFPLWNDEIIIQTWPLKPKRFEFERNYIVKDSNGNVIIRAISSWVIMDLETRELQKAELIEVDYPNFIENKAIDGKLGKLKPFGEPKVVYKKTIGYSDIDMNGHLTNSKYIDYIMDCFPCEGHKKYKVRTIQVSYVNEALPGETITLSSDISSFDSNSIYIEGINNNGGQIFSSITEIEPR